jgi:histone deacetylase complex regulatory component SIN3
MLTASMTQGDADRAIDYIHKVKNTLSPLEYDRFLTIMTEYKSSRCDMPVFTVLSVNRT